MNETTLLPAIDPAKRPHLYEIAYFALDASFALYEDLFPESAERMRSLARDIVQRAGYSPEPGRLSATIAELAPADARFVVRWINDGSFSGSARSQSLHLLEGVFDRAWVRSLGFEGRSAFVKVLGEDLYDGFSEIAEAHNARFGALDERSEEILAQPVSAADQRVLSQVLAPSTVADSLSYVMYYSLVEDIRMRLAALSLDAKSIDILETHMNLRLSKGGRGAPLVKDCAGKKEKWMTIWQG